MVKTGKAQAADFLFHLAQLVVPVGRVLEKSGNDRLQPFAKWRVQFVFQAASHPEALHQDTPGSAPGFCPRGNNGSGPGRDSRRLQ